LKKKKKRRKLCTDEVEGVKLKKNEKKKLVLQFGKKSIFFTTIFWLCISKMICRA
jgi:hypothetical protein